MEPVRNRRRKLAFQCVGGRPPDGLLMRFAFDLRPVQRESARIEALADQQLAIVEQLRLDAPSPRWTFQNRPLIDSSKPATTDAAAETSEFYSVAPSVHK